MELLTTKTKRLALSSNEPFFFEKGSSITINNASSSLFYYFEFDSRKGNIMRFQHFHQYYEILILLEGNANHIIKGEYYPINKYDIVLLHPLLLHKTEYPSEFLHRRLMINFLMPHEDPSIDFLMQPLLSLFHAELPIYRFSERVRTELFGILNDIFILKLEHPPSTDLLIHIRFIEFLCILYKYRRQNLYIRKPAVDYITQKIHSLTDYIHTNYSQRLSLKSLAERVYISPYYLSHLFKQITGFTLISYIQMTRVRNAQQLLLTSSLRISDISERCGFTSFPQFNRVFRKFCHISPSQFRDRIYQKNVPFYSDIPIFPEKETKYETE